VPGVRKVLYLLPQAVDQLPSSSLCSCSPESRNGVGFDVLPDRGLSAQFSEADIPLPPALFSSGLLFFCLFWPRQRGMLRILAELSCARPPCSYGASPLTASSSSSLSLSPGRAQPRAFEGMRLSSIVSPPLRFVLLLISYIAPHLPVRPCRLALPKQQPFVRPTSRSLAPYLRIYLLPAIP